MTPVCDCGNPLSRLQSDPTDADLAGMCGACYALKVLAAGKCGEMSWDGKQYVACPKSATHLDEFHEAYCDGHWAGRDAGNEDLPVSRSLGDY